MNEKKCLYCEKNFVPERSTKKYCSGSCRTNYFVKTRSGQKRNPFHDALQKILARR